MRTFKICAYACFINKAPGLPKQVTAYVFSLNPVIHQDTKQYSHYNMPAVLMEEA